MPSLEGLARSPSGGGPSRANPATNLGEITTAHEANEVRAGSRIRHSPPMTSWARFSETPHRIESNRAYLIPLSRPSATRKSGGRWVASEQVEAVGFSAPRHPFRVALTPAE